ncbi:glycoside hydrolase family 99-like domain-containing protein [Roseovarius sp. SCSIO 43702]|nr:glycoside hydrolase family 99-like domain-containing protein [Roseovarius sp. SCSIO 43702]
MRYTLARAAKGLRLFFPGLDTLRYVREMRRSGLFDVDFYRGAHPGLNRLCRAMPMRHYAIWGERTGLQPNPDFSPESYLLLNPDVASSGLAPFRHFISSGQKEGRAGRKVDRTPLPPYRMPMLRFDPGREKARFAIHLHIYYPDLWPEFASRLSQLSVGADLYVTITWRGDETSWLADDIREAFPTAFVTPVPNRGRDILPFLRLVEAGAFDGYEGVCKLHTKKSPHRQDGDAWRRHLVGDILPPKGLSRLIQGFIDDPDAAFLVADGQKLRAADWWGSNRDKAAAILRRVELDDFTEGLSFPAGSMYWLKPLMVGMIRSLRLGEAMFEPEQGQVDGTLAHAFERAIGGLADAAGQKIVQASEIGARPVPVAPRRPRFVSAFYLPQFHPIPENDAWWGKGFTEWRGVVNAVSAFPGHVQPLRPADLGFYDLRAPEVMAAQADLARQAGIDAFCVYHYWFGGHRVLEAPLDNLMKRREIDFPFYLCWANESWRRNWDGLSGEILLDQAYRPGFEAALVASTLPYMRDPRYQRPDGRRPRFVIYRPEDMPAPEQNVARLRKAWIEGGIGDVELGAVSFHLPGETQVAHDLFDFWVEMPPHGLVKGDDFVFGGPLGNRLGEATPSPDFGGLIYDYTAIARRSLTRKYRASLPPRTIAGIMPSWDNTARRGARAHIARGANPATYRNWLRGLQAGPLAGSYREELFINAWNEWAEKAMLEPSDLFGSMYLDVTRECLGRRDEEYQARRAAHG